MPFKSKAQQKFMFAAEERGEVPEGTARKWSKETPGIKELPEKVKKKKIQKKAFEMGIAQRCVELMEKSAFLPGRPADNPGAKNSFMPGKNLIAKINNFMDNETAHSMANKIQKDPRISPEQKKKLIKDILGLEQKYKGQVTDFTRAGEVTGLTGGALLTYLMAKNTKLSPGIKALLGSAIMLTSGIIGNVIGKSLSSGYYPAHPGEISYSKWKGLKV